MCNGDVEKVFVARLLCGPKQKFKVHHVVDDHRIIAIVVLVPGFDEPNRWFKPRGKRSSTGGKRLQVIWIFREAISVSEGAVQHKAKIVGTLVVFLAFNRHGPLVGGCFPLFVAGVFKQVPKRSAKKTTAPPIGCTVVGRAIGFGRLGEFGNIGVSSQHAFVLPGGQFKLCGHVHFWRVALGLSYQG